MAVSCKPLRQYLGYYHRPDGDPIPLPKKKQNAFKFSHLGHLEHGLGDVDNTSHLLDVLNAALDSLGVVGTRTVEDVLDLLVLALGPRLVSGTTVLDETTPDGQQADGHDGLLVHDVVLIADGVDAETSSAAEERRLAEEAASGEGVDDALSLLFGLLGGNVAGVADSSGGHGRDGSAGEGRSEKGSACSLQQIHYASANFPLPIGSPNFNCRRAIR